ncbi:MAG: 50S ribosomal protein L5 [Parcubacteria group bacterium]|nr:50S ribosomal protein L5 [Parcubacteria group bacterium]
MINLKEKISKDLKNIQIQLGAANIWAVPRLEKVVVNAGLGRAMAASAKSDDVLNKVSGELAAITGQKPVATKAKKAIASFKTRVGMPIGLKVTLHGQNMHDFLDRFIKIALPRTRDFRGLKESSVDKNGNLNVGIKDHTIFPEASADAAHTFSFEFTAVVNGSNRKKSLEFFKLLGFPFEKK